MNKYKEEMLNIKPSQTLIDRTKKQMRAQIPMERQGYMKKKIFRSSMIAGILLLSVTGVIAATSSSGGFQDLIYRINPGFHMAMHPVELSSIDQGIKMEVVAVGAYDEELRAYVTFQDLEGKNRINETTEVYGTVQLGDTPWGFNEMQDPHFCEDSGILTYLIRRPIWDVTEAIEVKFEVQRILSNPQYIHGSGHTTMLSNIMSDSLETVELTQKTWFLGSSSGIDYGVADWTMTALRPMANVYNFPGIDHAKISNVGVIDGRLHVQIWHDEDSGNGTNIIVIDNDGERVAGQVWQSRSSSSIGGGAPKWRTGHIGFGVDERGTPMDRPSREVIEGWDEDKREKNAPYYNVMELVIHDVDNIEGWHLFSSFEVLDNQFDLNLSVTTGIPADDKDVLVIDDIIQFYSFAWPATDWEVSGFRAFQTIITPFGVKFIGNTRDDQYIDLETLEVMLHGESDVTIEWLRDSQRRYVLRNDNIMRESIAVDAASPIDTSKVRAVTINGKNYTVHPK